MDDFLDNVLGDEPPVTEPEPVELQPSEEPALVESDAQPVQQAPEEPVQIEPRRAEPGYIPVAALLDERDKRKALEAQIAQYQSQQQAPAKPDPFDDPEGYEAYLGNTLSTALTEQRFQISAVMANSAHGADTVSAAASWAAEKAANDPGFRASWQQTLQADPHPMEWVVRQHKREALLSAIGDVPSVDDWFTQEAAKRGYVAMSASVAAAPAAVHQASRLAAPPRSIASEAPASAPATANDAKAEFEAIFSRG